MSHEQRLSSQELAVLRRAEHDGFLIRSGHRLAVLQCWRSSCRMRGRPCIVGIRGARQASVTVDGRDGWKGTPDELETAAARLAQPETTIFDRAPNMR